MLHKRTSTKAADLPIDKGWAWVIIVACAGLFCLVAGTFKCFGILKLQIEQEFDECPAGVPLWIASATSVVSLLAGPLCSFLLSKTCHRTMGMIGGVVCTLGIFLSAFAPNCYFLFFSFSFVYAVGVGCIMVVIFTAFASYFSKHKALAMGLVAAGSGLGGLVNPKLLQFLFDTLNYRDALISFAGVFLSSIAFSALLTPMSYFKKQLEKNNAEYAATEERPPLKYTEMDQICTDVSETSTSSLTSDDTKESMSEKLLIEESAHLDKANNNLNISSQQMFGSMYSLSMAAPFTSTTTINVPAEDNKLLDTGSKNITGATESDGDDPKNSSLPHSNNQQDADTANCCKQHLNVWINYRVMLIGLLLFFATNSINLIYTTAPSYAKEYNVSQSEVTDIMLYTAIGEIGMRVFHGWFADRGIITALSQICIMMVVCTIGAVLSSSLPGVAGITIIYSAMALAGTTIYSLIPIVVIELMGKEHLVTVMGGYYVYQAAAFIVSSSISNELHRVFESYTVVFYYIGACYAMSALIGLSTFAKLKISQFRRKHQGLSCKQIEPKPIVTVIENGDC